MDPFNVCPWCTEHPTMNRELVNRCFSVRISNMLCLKRVQWTLTLMWKDGHILMEKMYRQNIVYDVNIKTVLT